jgi:hypothetical protein
LKEVFLCYKKTRWESEYITGIMAGTANIVEEACTLMYTHKATMKPTQMLI